MFKKSGQIYKIIKHTILIQKKNFWLQINIYISHTHSLELELRYKYKTKTDPVSNNT